MTNAAQPVNWRPIFALGTLLVLCGLTWVIMQHLRAKPALPGIVGEIPHMRTLKMPEAAPTTVMQAVAQHVLPAPATTPAPHAQPTPCHGCQEVMEDYRNAIQAGFPDRRDVFVAPSIMGANHSIAPNAAFADGFHR